MKGQDWITFCVVNILASLFCKVFDFDFLVYLCVLMFVNTVYTISYYLRGTRNEI